DGAEGSPYFVEILRVLLRQRLQLANDAAADSLPDLHQLRVVLQHFAGDVERKVFAVDHAPDEAKVSRQQVGVVGDENATHIKLHLPLARGLEQVERLGRWREQQHRVGI